MGTTGFVGVTGALVGAAVVGGVGGWGARVGGDVVVDGRVNA